MTENEYSRPDESGVLHAAVIAVMLIAMGLGVMAWDNYRAQNQALRTVASAIDARN